MKRTKICFIAGARPNFMKIAPVMNALRSCADEIGRSGIRFDQFIVHTGQHYDKNMSEVFFRELQIDEPRYNLEAGSGSHAEQTARVMVEFEKVLLLEKPDLVVVVGDVNSTIACSLTAKKLDTPVAHVEAGLRSFDMKMPEEINRKLTDAISDYLFVTEESGMANLRKEGVAEERIFFVGNVMIDTLMQNLKKLESGAHEPSREVEDWMKDNPRYGVLTLHRPSNVDVKDVFSGLWESILRIVERLPIIFPVHPRTRRRMREFGLDTGHVSLVEPLGYMDMLCLVKGSSLVLTDSGGLQEETTALGVPCVTIRENTERPSTVEVGTNYLVGTDPREIYDTARLIIEGKGKKGSVPPLWDGNAAGRIAGVLMDIAARGGRGREAG